MMNRLLRKSITLILLLLFFTSCALLGKKPEKEEKHNAIEIAQAYLTEGDFQKAIDTYNVAYNKYPDDFALRSNYIKTIYYIKKNADIAFHREDFASAGFIYRILLNNYAQVKDLVSSSSFNEDFLSKRIKTCSKTLTEKGLVEYRDGNLREAISIWRNILTFDPENAEVKKAIDTATIQLKNLQK